MRATTQIIKPVILEIIEKVVNKYPYLKKDFEFFYNKRIHSNKLLLRPFLARIIYEFSGRNDWEKHKEVFALIEILNISTYQSNIAFDNKNGITSDLSKNNQFISSIFSKFSIINEILSDKKYSKKIKHQIMEEISNSIEKTYYGQFIDLNILNFSETSYLHDEKKFKKIYEKRCYYLGSGLIRLCSSIPIILLRPTLNNIEDKLYNFSDVFGTAGQILNDIGDFKRGGETYSLNQFSDINNGRLTFPVRELALLDKSKTISKRRLIQLALDDDTLNMIIDKVDTLLSSYKKMVFRIIQQIDKSDYNVQNLILIANILQKSCFLERTLK